VVTTPARDQHTLTQVRGPENLREGVVTTPARDQHTLTQVRGREILRKGVVITPVGDQHSPHRYGNAKTCATV